MDIVGGVSTAEGNGKDVVNAPLCLRYLLVAEATQPKVALEDVSQFVGDVLNARFPGTTFMSVSCSFLRMSRTVSSAVSRCLLLMGLFVSAVFGRAFRLMVLAKTILAGGDLLWVGFVVCEHLDRNLLFVRRPVGGSLLFVLLVVGHQPSSYLRFMALVVGMNPGGFLRAIQLVAGAGLGVYLLPVGRTICGSLLWMRSAVGAGLGGPFHLMLLGLGTHGVHSLAASMRASYSRTRGPLVIS